MSVLQTVAVLCGVAFATVLLLVAVGQWRWNGLTGALFDRIERVRRDPPTARFHTAELASLPPVVQRYFRAVLVEGAPIVTGVTVEHAGSFDLGGGRRPQWKPFTSQQRVATRRPGFVWDARVRMLPGVDVHVHDAYVAGEGLLRPALMGVVGLGEQHGGVDLARGELMRWFAEAAWYPTALLPSQGVRWSPVDEQTARATLTDGDLSLTLTFTFDDEGLIAMVRAAARARTVRGVTELRPWEGRFADYTVIDAMRVPLSAEVAWLMPADEGGRQPYWRGTITALSYTFAD
jgi:hypothetical protein